MNISENLAVNWLQFWGICWLVTSGVNAHVMHVCRLQTQDGMLCVDGKPVNGTFHVPGQESKTTPLHAQTQGRSVLQAEAWHEECR